MGSSKAPKTPDYTGAAIAQGESDRSTAEYLTNANRVNQIDPYGQTTWSRTPSDNTPVLQMNYDELKNRIATTPNAPKEWSSQLAALQNDLEGSQRWTQTTSLSPAQQALLTQQESIKGLQNTRTQDLLKTFNPSEGDIGDNIYKSITSRYDDRFAKDEAATRAALANQGFQTGSEGFNNSLTDFNRSKNDAYGDAAVQSKIAGLNQYNTEMGYLGQLLGGVQGPTNPQYQPYAQATSYQSPDLLGAMQGQYQGDLNQTNAQNASRSQTIGAVGTIASAAAIAF